MIRPIILTILSLGLAAHAYPSEHQHLEHIPVPDYNPKIQFLGQHVDLHEVPTKVIRITKTVAIKVPVPYPVKIPHNVPYPVHVNKPYPVPVPQIIKVPQPIPVHVLSSGASHGLSLGHLDNSLDSGSTSHYQSPLSSYNVEESGHDTSGSDVSGYAGQFDHGGSEQYGESKQVESNPVVFTSSSAYQPTQEASTYQQSAQMYQKLSQEAYTPNAEPTSDNQRIDSRSYRHAVNPGNRQNRQQYQIRVPVHYMQAPAAERYRQ